MASVLIFSLSEFVPASLHYLTDRYNIHCGVNEYNLSVLTREAFWFAMSVQMPISLQQVLVNHGDDTDRVHLDDFDPDSFEIVHEAVKHSAQEVSKAICLPPLCDKNIIVKLVESEWTLPRVSFLIGLTGAYRNAPNLSEAVDTFAATLKALVGDNNEKPQHA